MYMPKMLMIPLMTKTKTVWIQFQDLAKSWKITIHIPSVWFTGTIPNRIRAFVMELTQNTQRRFNCLLFKLIKKQQIYQHYAESQTSNQVYKAQGITSRKG